MRRKIISPNCKKEKPRGKSNVNIKQDRTKVKSTNQYKWTLYNKITIYKKSLGDV